MRCMILFACASAGLGSAFAFAANTPTPPSAVTSAPAPAEVETRREAAHVARAERRELNPRLNPMSENGRKSIAELQRQVDGTKNARTVQQLERRMAQVKREGIPIEREEVDLSEICRFVIDGLKAAHGRSIRFAHAGDLLGFCDRDRLFQLYSTLGGNACQHRPVAMPVLVRADGTQTNLFMLEVSNAVVIAKHFLPVIFDPLHVGTGSGREGISGLRFGLHVNQQIVVAYGGTIRVESSEEKGPRFDIGLTRRST